MPLHRREPKYFPVFTNVGVPGIGKTAFAKNLSSLMLQAFDARSSVHAKQSLRDALDATHTKGCTLVLANFPVGGVQNLDIWLAIEVLSSFLKNFDIEKPDTLAEIFRHSANPTQHALQIIWELSGIPEDHTFVPIVHLDELNVVTGAFRCRWGFSLFSLPLNRAAGGADRLKLVGDIVNIFSSIYTSLYRIFPVVILSSTFTLGNLPKFSGASSHSVNLPPLSTFDTISVILSVIPGMPEAWVPSEAIIRFLAGLGGIPRLLLYSFVAMTMKDNLETITSPLTQMVDIRAVRRVMDTAEQKEINKIFHVLSDIVDKNSIVRLSASFDHLESP